MHFPKIVPTPLFIHYWSDARIAELARKSLVSSMFPIFEVPAYRKRLHYAGNARPGGVSRGVGWVAAWGLGDPPITLPSKPAGHSSTKALSESSTPGWVLLEGRLILAFNSWLKVNGIRSLSAARGREGCAWGKATPSPLQVVCWFFSGGAHHWLPSSFPQQRLGGVSPLAHPVQPAAFLGVRAVSLCTSATPWLGSDHWWVMEQHAAGSPGSLDPSPV